MARFGLTQVVKLGSNENPLGVSPRVRDAVIRILDRAHHYPDGESTRLRGRLAGRFGLTPEHFCVANGADNILTCLGLAFVERGDRCVTGLPTYTAYAGLVRLLEGELVEVPLREWTFDVRALAEAAEAALDDDVYARAAYENNRAGKAALAQGLTALGLRPLPSQANFVLVDLGRPAATVAERLLERGVIIRPGGMWRLPMWARITVGTPQEIARLLEALSTV